MVAVAAEPLLCRYRRLAIERQERDLERLPELGYWFDEAEADRIVYFIEGFARHHKGEWAGQPITLEPWEAQEVLRPIFGWMRPDGTRRFRTAYIEIPRKNGKSVLSAATGIYLTSPDGEPGAEVYCAATKEKQAKIVHEMAKAMVRASPDLSDVFKVRWNNIHVRDGDSKFEPVGSDSDRLDGLNAHGIIIDEMHALKKRHLLDVLQTSMGARRQPLTLIITTAGVYDPEAIGWQMHQDALKILEGAIEDESFFAYVCSADDGDDWKDSETWRKANPNYDVSVKPEYLAEEAKKAERTPSYLNTFLRYHLNIWVQQDKRWISPDAWAACPQEPKTLEDMRGRVCMVGLDLSTKIDISAAAFVFPPDSSTGVWDMIWRFWVPEALVDERARRGLRPDYAAWVRDGWLTPTPGDVIDYEFIQSAIVEASDVVKIHEVPFDPWNATETGTRLGNAGLEVVEMRQGYQTMSEPTKNFEALVIAKRLNHGGNPVMTWMVSNAVTRMDPNGNIMPDKGKATGKIDGLPAAIMGLGRGMVYLKSKDSVYARRGIRAL